MRLTRAGNENDVMITSYQHLLAVGRDNLLLGAGDVWFVPDLTITVLGSVKRPGDIPYKEGLTVSRCLAIGSSRRSRCSESHSRVGRGPDGVASAVRLLGTERLRLVRRPR
ncbi:MAG: hypothetical protein CL927_14020 [Deltaproteobacteria bacterium]|nr:hypothetical protein [Deltaproteobacteria bacterium]HCH65888.1 hypothetical protein [Deltaproteobacteria bacterium]